MPRKKSLSALVHLRLKKELQDRIDEFRWEYRFESRTEAINWLLEYALSQNPKPKK
jgi:metal-responsive CopG/Arc/MetJ family transcriptional regulator